MRVRVLKHHRRHPEVRRRQRFDARPELFDGLVSLRGVVEDARFACVAEVGAVEVGVEGHQRDPVGAVVRLA